MRLKLAFGSHIESRVVLMLFIAIALPTLLVSVFAYEYVRQQGHHQLERQVKYMAKDYGMLLLERIRSEFKDELNQARTQYGKASTDLGLKVSKQSIVLQVAGIENHRPRDRFMYDLMDLDQGRRCVLINGEGSCPFDPETEVSAQWDLRLVSLFNSDDVISVVTVLPITQTAQLSLLSTLAPLIMLVVAVMACYATMIFVRRRLSPIPILKRGIQRIESGEFDTKVDVQTNDEFADLGGALNSLAEQLGQFVSYRESLSHMDKQMLSGAELDDVLKAICQLAVTHAGTHTAYFVILESPDAAHIVGIASGSQVQRRTKLLKDRSMRQQYNHHTYPITVDRKSWGWMVVGQASDVDEERILELAQRASVAATNAKRAASLFQQATYDDLTGLLNRTTLLNALQKAVSHSQRSNALGALIFLDLDQFKFVNDTEGHTVGDELLCVVAQRLIQTMRDIDAVGRLGGDEFAIVLSQVENREALVAILQRIVQVFQEPVELGSATHIVSCSIGVCLLPDDGHTAETLLKNVDLAMYRAKAVPGNSYVFFNQEFNKVAERRVTLEGKLREALKNKAIEVFYQPKLNLALDRLDSFEALTRWHDEEMGWIDPEEFIGIAERAGLIEQLTEIVFERVAQLLLDRPPLEVRKVAVNISPIQLRAHNCVELILNVLQRTGCEPGRVELEITESIFVTEPQAVKRKLAKLKDAGISVSLDDFGTGYSSLNLMTQLSLDGLKVDKSFVDRIPTQKETTHIVSKIVEMARGLDIDVIAEGVETAEQLDTLKQMGCTHIQGYFVSKPLPRLELEELLDSLKVESRRSAVR